MFFINMLVLVVVHNLVILGLFCYSKTFSEMCFLESQLSV